MVFILALLLACNPAHGQSETTAPSTAIATHISLTQAAILGVVEGLTEYLPVSSTGHLILAAHWMGLGGSGGEQNGAGPKLRKDPALDAFEIVIQLGAILAVLGLYRKRVGQMCLGLIGRDKTGFRLFGTLIVAFLPAALIGFFCEKTVKHYLFSPIPVAIALATGGFAMILIERAMARRGPAPVQNLDDVRMKQALIIGLAQCIALCPGVSRSMITIIAGLVVGLNIITAAEFSFLLALPTLGAATVYEGIKSWHALMNATGPTGLAIGLITSGIVAALAVKGLVKWLTGHGLLPFGIYRILLGLAVLLLL